MTIAKRLIILVGLPLVVIIGLSIVTRIQLSTIEDRSRFISAKQVPSVVTLGNISRSFAEMRLSLRNDLLARTPDEQSRARAAFQKSEADLNRLLAQYADSHVTDEKDRRLLNEYRLLTSNWIAEVEKVMTLVESGNREQAATHFYTTVAYGDRIEQASAEWVRHNEDLAKSAGLAVAEAIEVALQRILIATLLALVISGVLGYLTLRRIVDPIRALESSVKTIAAGDYDQDVPFSNASDETGGLARSIDVLKDGAAAMERQRWVEKHVSELAARLHSATSLSEFGESLLSRLLPTVGGGVAAIYVMDTETKRLNRFASYGLSEGTRIKDSFDMSEGLVGQCARERSSISLDHLPPEYLQIASGLGSSAPVQVVASPLMSRDDLLGVLELASFRKFAESEQALLNELLPRAALSLEILQSNLSTRALLVQTQEQARQLEEQTEELTQSQEELLAQKRELTAQREELQTNEARLRETEQFYRSVLELAPDGMMVVNADGIIQLSNAQCEKLFGYTREELNGHSVEMLVPEDVRPNHPALRASFHNDPVTRAMGRTRVLNAVRKDGSLFPVEVGLSPVLKHDGQAVKVAVSIRDVTETRKHEEALREAKAKAEEATDMKSMFLANMSHEIRTPMNAIIGLSHLALRTPLNPKQRDYISKVHNAGTSLLAIINDVLDFSKIEAGKLDIEITDFEIDEVISSVTTVTAQKAHEKGLEFLADVSSAIPEQLRGDPLRLGQVLTNLINNAVKFTERGEIHLKIELLEQTGDKVHVKFSVRDTGIGMTAEQAAKLFQPFSQADMSTTRKHGGTGLGLSISRRLIELMGGQIWLETKAGVGSTFIFAMWLEVGKGESRRLVPKKFQSLKVLVVDDNSAAREILVESLHNMSERVDAVSSGPEALAAIRERDADSPYDVVFMDWRMPGMDGLECTRLIKNDTSLHRMPSVIIVTAFGRDEVREEAEQMHVEGFLVKPVTKSMLVDSLVNIFATEEESPAPVAGGIESRLAGVRILLAEDNEINQQIATELLEGAGATVDVANNGREAVDKLLNGVIPPPYDVVLMDLQMPEMDGYQATARIRSHKRLVGLPIIAMTAHATIEERNRCLEAGMNDHVAKPISPDILFETIARYRSPEVDPSYSTQVMPVLPVLRDELAHIEGLDFTDGLLRVAGNKDLYLKLIRQFMEAEKDVPARIVERLRSDDYATAERIAHTVKGVAGNLGAKKVQSAAADLELAIKQKASSTETLCNDLEIALSSLIASLERALGQEPEQRQAPGEAQQVDSSKVRETVARMSGYLDDFDPAAVECLASELSSFRALFDAATLAKFEEHVNGYAFAEAHALLEKAAKAKGV